MTSVHSYTFDNLSRIGDDQCNLSQKNVQNAEYGTYSTTNYFVKYCGNEKANPICYRTTWYILHGWLWQLLWCWRM